jgi:MFS family permease
MRTLRLPDFRRLWLAGLISDTGDWLLLASLPILVYLYTGSTLGTAIAFIVELVPPALLAPLAGHIADRLDRRLAMMTINAAQAIALFPLMLVHGPDQLPIVYAVIAMQAGLASLFDPVKNALLPTLVPSSELVHANSLVGLNQNIGRLIGAPLGGALLAMAGGLATIVAVDAASFLIAVGLIARLTTTPPARDGIRIPEPRHEAPQSWRAAVQPRPIRAGLALMLIASVAQGLFVVLYVVFVERALHGGPGEIGLLRGVQAIGAIGGGLLLALVARVRPGRLTALSAFGFGLLDLIIWNAPRLTTEIWAYGIAFAVVGLPGVAMMTGLLSAMQAAAPEAVRGRVFAAFGVAVAAGQALGMVAGGVLGDRVGVIPLLNIQGVLYLVSGGIAALWLAREDPGAQRSEAHHGRGQVGADQDAEFDEPARARIEEAEHCQS